MTIQTTTMTPTVGLEITGMTADELIDPRVARNAQRALDEHGVVVYREVHVTDDQLLGFSRLLGAMVIQPTGEHRYPEIQTITLDPAKTNAMLASYRQGNFHWHIDGATDAIPQKATLLTAREVDPAGGDTEFANTYAAYRRLPDVDREEIAQLRVEHSFAHAQGLANPDATDEQRSSWERVPARVHPLVWEHTDGRRSLVLGATAARVVGWSEKESRVLLDRLLAWTTQPRFTLRHQWRRGDLVMWDNTGMLHRALSFEPTSVRLMHRTTLRGDEPISTSPRTSTGKVR